MSAGQSMRRGYLYAIPPTTHLEQDSRPRNGSPGLASFIFAAAVLVIIAIVASDETLGSSIARVLSALWSEAASLLRHAASRT
jgi:hypothetical protein